MTAAHTGDRCDLPTDTERKGSWKPTVEDAVGWTDDRVVRAVYLRHLLVDEKLPIRLIGARIDGDLDLEGGRSITLSLPQSVLTGTAGGSAGRRSPGTHGSAGRRSPADRATVGPTTKTSPPRMAHRPGSATGRQSASNVAAM
ncbi:hypothetical protein [Gordonia amicalis]|uniref:hypothetical protein n=1 Tax=Gordonia amicalis TaxID=89053 RepID=UPI0022A660E2|nr:hypothetical protein [Gordonia amicalis]MCZ0912892.1 hypothetical protein [Gordonia amicalis]MCZ4579664.1 hypothetical protein [Gordonia amicalis]MCZ4652243.1 hypothetical protein [Gordonia amicalis]MDJ0455511.1 hypothetical protein [Gordonia amicalis]MDV7078967.1 hypothetical protein [Gordonia amicalis]